MTPETTSGSAVHVDDEGYEDLLASVRARFEATTAGPGRLFTTTASGLFDAFLGALPAERRQYYTCAACRRFVGRFGGVVLVSPDGAAASATWDEETAPPFFRGAVSAMAKLVSRARVNGVFLCERTPWGEPQTGTWRHLAVVPRAALVFEPSAIMTVGQTVAEKREDHGTLCRGLAEFSPEVVAQARTLLAAEALYRSEKCLGVAKWLGDLHEARAATRSEAARENLTWLAVATAPAGFCHIKSTMIGTLLEDIAAGKPFADVKASFDAKMHPLQYQRPTAAPSAGNVAQAEKIVAQLASAGALARRFARLDDLQALWKPTPKRTPAETGGVFSHLETRASRAAAPRVEMPAITMTWEKFARAVLPEAERIEFHVPAMAQSYAALVTAANPAAPPIIQWDREEKRNPVTWYFYSGGSRPEDWSLRSGTFSPVTAVTLQPSMWDAAGRFAHHGEKVFFLLEGARDLRYAKGSGFFPEMLRSEYHAVRATMEAYARSALLEGKDEASACGIGLQKGSGTWGHAFRVTAKGGACVTYTLDRWD